MASLHGISPYFKSNVKYRKIFSFYTRKLAMVKKNCTWELWVAKINRIYVIFMV